MLQREQRTTSAIFVGPLTILVYLNDMFNVCQMHLLPTACHGFQDIQHIMPGPLRTQNKAQH